MDAINHANKLKGLFAARSFARRGKFIFAIKHLERTNPAITIQEAKAIVASFGYGDPPERPEKGRRPISIV